MPTINNLRQQAATIKNATQVGENTATRVGTTFETIADLLESMGGVANLSTIDIGSIDTLNTTGDMLVGTPNIYTLTKTIGANTFKVGTLFQFANNGRYDVAQVIMSQFVVDADGRIDTTSADQEVHIFYRLCKTMNEGSLPTPIGTWTTWTELGGSGGSGVTVDPYPTQDSGNAVSSGGVFERLQDVAPKVDISAIDDIDEYSDMLARVSPFYVVTKTLSGNVFRIGTLMEFANQGRYILYQILATDYVLNDDGTLDTTLSENGGLKLIWRMKQFSGNPPAGVTIGAWSAWSYLSGGDSGYQPDNEDIDLNADNQLQFANKAYDASAFSGLGRVYLRKNIVTSGGVDKNVLTQAIVNTANTIYHIQYDYDLNGQTITLPANVTLQFEGGSLANGTIVGNNTMIDSVNVAFKKDLTIQGTWKNEVVYSRWFDFISSEDGVTDNSLQFKQLQAVINGTKGCRVEFENGYYQTSIERVESGETAEIDGVTYPKWRPGASRLIDSEIVLNVIDLSFVEIDLNGATIHLINITDPKSNIIVLTNVSNGYVHNGKLIGMAANGFLYPQYANQDDVLSNSYEWGYGIYQVGGFTRIEDVDCSYFTGDGIVVGSGPWLYTDKRGLQNIKADGYVVRRCSVSYCGRNGITLHSSNKSILEDCTIHHIGSDGATGAIGTDGVMGYSPRSGIDAEFEDGQGLQPICEWRNLHISDCAEKSIVVASGSIFKKFTAHNLKLDIFPVLSNLVGVDGCIFSDSYFRYTGIGSGYGVGINFVNCEFEIAAFSMPLGANNYDGCIFTDTNPASESGKLFAINYTVATFRNCRFDLHHAPGYFTNWYFYGCEIHLDKAFTIRGISEYYDCLLDFKEDNGLTASFGDIVSESQIILALRFERCHFPNNCIGSGNDVSSAFISNTSADIIIKDCRIDGKLVINPGTYAKKIYIDGCRIFDFAGNAYGQSTGDEFIIRYSVFETFSLRSNTQPLKIYKSILTLYWTSAYRSAGDNIYFYDCDIALDKSGAITNFNATKTSINFNLPNADVTSFTLIDCYITGNKTEAQYNGVKKNCTFETSFATSGTTEQRPSASVAGVGFKYFDTTLAKPIWSDGTAWVDATGAAVQ